MVFEVFVNQFWQMKFSQRLAERWKTQRPFLLLDDDDNDDYDDDDDDEDDDDDDDDDGVKELRFVGVAAF